MTRRDLLQRVSQPSRAATERKQNQRCFRRQSVDLRECRECEVDIGPFADSIFDNIAQLRVFRGKVSCGNRAVSPRIARG